MVKIFKNIFLVSILLSLTLLGLNILPKVEIIEDKIAEVKIHPQGIVLKLENNVTCFCGYLHSRQYDTNCNFLKIGDSVKYVHDAENLFRNVCEPA
jgi:hypothetical protein